VFIVCSRHPVFAYVLYGIYICFTHHTKPLRGHLDVREERGRANNRRVAERENQQKIDAAVQFLASKGIKTVVR